jgi:hypothetical protein
MERQQVPGLVARLVEAGVSIYRVAAQEPSLEDVYFAIHGEPTQHRSPEQRGRRDAYARPRAAARSEKSEEEAS